MKKLSGSLLLLIAAIVFVFCILNALYVFEEGISSYSIAFLTGSTTATLVLFWLAIKALQKGLVLTGFKKQPSIE